MKIDRIPTNSKVVFIITVRNAVTRIKECLESVERQTCESWRCIVTDDASDDGTQKIIENFTHGKSRYLSIFNNNRKWKMENFTRATQICEPHDIVVELDGDDRLCDLDFVDNIIAMHNWYDVVWTQHKINDAYFPEWHNWKSTPLPDNWNRVIPFRETVFSPKMYPGHIRTFKKMYFDKIDPKDLLFQGKTLQVTSDVAYYTPIIEMSHPSLRYFFDRECAVYNIEAENDTLTDRKYKKKNMTESDERQLQSDVGRYIKQLTPYSVVPLKHRIIFIPDQDVEQWYRVARQYALLDPFSRIHLFAFNYHSAKRILSYSRVPNMFVYDLDYIVNNSLSTVRGILQKNIVVTIDTIKHLYFFCLKYIATHFHHDLVILYPVDLAEKVLKCNKITEILLHGFDQTHSLSISLNKQEEEDFINHKIKETLSSFQENHLDDILS